MQGHMLDLVTSSRENRFDFFRPSLERTHHDVESLGKEKQESSYCLDLVSFQSKVS